MKKQLLITAASVISKILRICFVVIVTLTFSLFYNTNLQNAYSLNEEIKTFSSYESATSYVENNLKGESVNTSKSSFITHARYYYANGQGFFLLGMNGKTYIYQGVPIEVWNMFKNADSFGKAYNSMIRGRYRADLPITIRSESSAIKKTELSFIPESTLSGNALRGQSIRTVQAVEINTPLPSNDTPSNNFKNTIEINEEELQQVKITQIIHAKYYNAALKSIKESDEEAAKIFENSESLWKTAYNQYCDSIYQYWISGTIRTVKYETCLIEQIKQRTHDIWRDFILTEEGSSLLPEPK
jgi:hypothetical protein